MDSGLRGNDVQDTDCFAVLAMTDGRADSGGNGVAKGFGILL
jgi:hypothetical protein